MIWMKNEEKIKNFNFFINLIALKKYYLPANITNCNWTTLTLKLEFCFFHKL